MKLKTCNIFPVIVLKWMTDFEMPSHFHTDADGRVNTVGPDQSVPLRAVWSGSILFAQTCWSSGSSVG